MAGTPGETPMRVVGTVFRTLDVPRRLVNALVYDPIVAWRERGAGAGVGLFGYNAVGLIPVVGRVTHGIVEGVQASWRGDSAGWSVAQAVGKHAPFVSSVWMVAEGAWGEQLGGAEHGKALGWEQRLERVWGAVVDAVASFFEIKIAAGAYARVKGGLGAKSGSGAAAPAPAEPAPPAQPPGEAPPPPAPQRGVPANPGNPFPANAQPGQTLTNINPNTLQAGRGDLVAGRLATQQQLIQQGTPRTTPIQVTPDGVIWDGNHGARAAAQAGVPVTVQVVPGTGTGRGPVTGLPIRP